MSLRIEAAHRAFRARGRDDVVALDGVDLTVGEGELLVVVGRSGSGKTTLLRVVAGLEPLDSGRVLLDGEDLTATAPGARGVALVFQEAALFPHLRVRDNIGIGERARGADRKVTEAAVVEVAATLDVEDLLDRTPSELSGGERQRVALARAMIRSPRALLLDEPLAAVDAEQRGRMRGVIRDVQRRLGVPMIHVTHDQSEAMALGDRVALMDRGRVVQCDTPDALYAAPSHVAVARGFGPLPMNILPPERGVCVGVRPERVRLDPSGSGPLCAVMEREPAGEDSLIHLVCAPEGTAVVARVPRGSEPRPGDQVRLSWDPAHEHRFNATTGERVA
ncbi:MULTISPECIES: ABC transporter ATP-binding protein [unclassified Knoellia]|uniref:ABC transporter ATP-binding protein n=1 Tax=Knoellia altitudinis TaxID=3404795 RepID=UPI00362003FE